MVYQILLVDARDTVSSFLFIEIDGLKFVFAKISLSMKNKYICIQYLFFIHSNKLLDKIFHSYGTP